MTILPRQLLQLRRMHIPSLLFHFLTPQDSGSTLVIHTYAYYVQNAITALQAKGAIPILSSVTPDNIWTGSAISAGGRFVTYAKDAASRTGITYVDHYDYVAQAYDALGQTTVTTYYPIDHLHTSPAGALVVAEAFLRGLLCGSSTLTAKVNSKGLAVPSEYFLIS